MRALVCPYSLKRQRRGHGACDRATRTPHNTFHEGNAQRAPVASIETLRMAAVEHRAHAHAQQRQESPLLLQPAIFLYMLHLASKPLFFRFSHFPYFQFAVLVLFVVLLFAAVFCNASFPTCIVSGAIQTVYIKEGRLAFWYRSVSHRSSERQLVVRRMVVETQVHKLPDTSDTIIGRACDIFHL